MLSNTITNPHRKFEALSSTPAVHLTQNLPPEAEHADILLLGCGDARSILFTLHNAKPGVSFDITCNDVEPAVIARNILLFSFLIDGDASTDNQAIWDIYLNLSINTISEEYSRPRRSMQEWRNSPYGETVRFCDGRTLVQVRGVWRAYYSLCVANGTKIVSEKDLDNAFGISRKAREDLGEGTTLGAIQSAAPFGLEASNELTDLNKQYWSTGTIDPASKNQSLNPTFFLDANRVLQVHPATDPLPGFHLAPAYAVVPTSMTEHHPNQSDLHRVVQAAKTEFFEWIASFRASAKDFLVIRFFAGDALAFAHTLQHMVDDPIVTTANSYRNPWSFEKLIIDDRDYHTTSKRAPYSFDVIDTSNLLDNVGFLNIATACEPLMKKAFITTLYTQSIASNSMTPAERRKHTLGGDTATVSLLVGLASVESWFKTTATSDVDEGVAHGVMRAASVIRNVRSRIPSKRLDSLASPQPTLSVNPNDLAVLLTNIHYTMLRYENPITLARFCQEQGLDPYTNPCYNRLSFVLLLKHIKSRILTDWHLCFTQLLIGIQNHVGCRMSANFFQDLCAYLHMYGLYTTPMYRSDAGQFSELNPPAWLTRYGMLPEVVAITMHVPGAKLRYFAGLEPAALGTSCLCGQIENKTAKLVNLFSATQVAFGRVQVLSTEPGGLRVLTVKEGEQDWSGSTPLIVSFYMPSWLLLKYSAGTTVTLGLQVTEHAIQHHVGKLGAELEIHSRQLSDTNGVFISRFLPNMTSSPAVGAADALPKELNELALVRPQIEALSDRDHIRLATLELQLTSLEQLPPDLGQISAVTLPATMPNALWLSAGAQSPIFLEYPAPVSSARTRIEVNEQQLAVKATAPVLSALDIDFPLHATFPLAIDVNGPHDLASWHMPYINLDTLPTIALNDHTSKQWLMMHLSFMYSDQESVLRRHGQDLNPSLLAVSMRRLDVKASLFTMFGAVAGLRHSVRTRAAVFCLQTGSGRSRMLLFVRRMQIDLANRTVVLDAAAMLLSEALMQDLMTVISLLEGSHVLVNLEMSDEAFETWSNILPAFAERCRDWKHDMETCEYVKSRQAPPKAVSNGDHAPLCSCGWGHDMADEDAITHNENSTPQGSKGNAVPAEQVGNSHSICSANSFLLVTPCAPFFSNHFCCDTCCAGHALTTHISTTIPAALPKHRHTPKHNVMILHKPLLTSLSLLPTASTAPTTNNPQTKLTYLIAFGDELTDNGNGSSAHGIAGDPATIYGYGTWTNGPVAVSYLSSELSLPLTANYAFGGCCGGSKFGATLDNSYTPSDAGVPSLIEQIGNYSGAIADGRLDPSESLAFIWAGQNDLSGHTDAFWYDDPKNQEFADDLATHTISAVQKLFDLGMPRVMVVNLYPKHIAPVTAAYLCGGVDNECTRTWGRIISDANENLRSALTNAFGDRVIYYDVYSYMLDLAENAEGYGFTAPLTKFCDGQGDESWEACMITGTGADGNTEIVGWNEFFWMSFVQPTTRVHELVGRDMTRVVKEALGL
ncbi:hypothetical protein PMZ80_008193 [Knufia obscura]|uniref:DUF4470 domain-containing protein n=1 Tax=Knufia obscura TaxID=1635080 RepID=A0ABR0RGQ0_9EURO|nr:hypothetical protein PMZ80_008193 [Knufia obscura]